MERWEQKLEEVLQKVKPEDRENFKNFVEGHGVPQEFKTMLEGNKEYLDYMEEILRSDDMMPTLAELGLFD